jgi:hypothetical protein
MPQHLRVERQTNLSAAAHKAVDSDFGPGRDDFEFTDARLGRAEIDQAMQEGRRRSRRPLVDAPICSLASGMRMSMSTIRKLAPAR